MLMSDLDAVKRTAKFLLYTEINLTEFSPIVVQHPFTSSGFTMVNKNGKPELIDITSSEDNADEWRKTVSQQIEEARNAFQIYMVIILGQAIAVWVIYALLALAFKHKIGWIIASIGFIACGIVDISLYGDFLMLISSIIAIFFIYFIVPLQIKSEKKEQWKQWRRDNKGKKR